jgi:hypothetical protein
VNGKERALAVVTGRARADVSFSDETLLTASELIAQLNDARARLDEGTRLIALSLDLREQLAWGVLGLHQARDLVAELSHLVVNFKRRARP